MDLALWEGGLVKNTSSIVGEVDHFRRQMCVCADVQPRRGLAQRLVVDVEVLGVELRRQPRQVRVLHRALIVQAQSEVRG